MNGLFAMLTDEQKEAALNADFDESFGDAEYRKTVHVDQSISINLEGREPDQDRMKEFMMEMIKCLKKN